MRTVPLLGLCLLLAGCPAGRDTSTPHPVAKPPSAPFPSGMSDDQRAYLTEIYAQIQPWWYVALKKAGQSYPADHCVNDRSLEAAVEVQFNDADRPGRQALQHSSGCKLFDESALSVLQWMRDVPVRPKSLAGKEGRLLLHWRFFRDKRGCEPAFARLELSPFSPAERMTRALERRDWVAAGQVLSDAGRTPPLLAVLARVGLSSREPTIRRAALGVSTSDQVMAMLLKDRDAQMWAAGIRVLESRRADGTLVGLLKELARSGRAKDGPLVTALLGALERLKVAIPAIAIEGMLTHAAVEVMLAGLDSTSETTTLAKAREALKKTPERMGALAVRWCSLKADPKAEQVVRWALSGTGRTLTLEALLRHPLRQLDKEVEALVRSDDTPAADRVLAIRVLAGAKDASLTALRLALAAKSAEVQIAAARALGSAQRDRVASTYRLAKAARKARGAAAAACLAAMARLGHEPFRREVLRMMKRLPERERATVVAALQGYGEAAVPDLIKIARGAKGPLRSAALSSLAKIPGEAARKALDELPAPPPQPPSSQPQRSPLEELLLLAGAG